MSTRKIIQLHIIESDVFEFYGSPASLYDKHSSNELLISQKALNNYFSKQTLSNNPLVYRNAYCEIRKGELYVKPSTRGRKKEGNNG